MRTPVRTALALAALGLAVAGCTEGGTTGTSPTPDATGTATTPAGAGGPIASCAAGDWRSTGADGTARAGSASAQITGGGGIAFKVGQDGQTTVDFSGMQPATFSVDVGGTEVAGQFSYAGTVAGAVRTGGGAEATSGTWEPVGDVDWGETRLTVELTKPVEAKPLDNARIGDYMGDSANDTGNVVDVDPLLGAGRFECRGDQLVLSPDDDGGITWTLQRA